MAKLISGRWVCHRLFRRGRTWYARLRDSHSGRLLEFSTRETDRDEAEQRLFDIVHDLDRRRDEAEPRRFDEAYGEFLEMTKVGRVRPSTLADYQRTYHKVFVPTFGELLADEVRPRDVEKFLRLLVDRRRSVRTQRKYLSELRGFFRWARRHRYCLEDPTDGIRLGRAPRFEGRALTHEEAAALLRACREPVVIQVRDRRRPAGWKQPLSPPPPHLFVAVLIGLHVGLSGSSKLRH